MKRWLCFILVFNFPFLLPNLQAQWVQCTGAVAGSILAFDSLGSIVFAGTQNSGLLRSTDNGIDWTVAQLGTVNYAVLGVALSDTVLYAASDSLYVSNADGSQWHGISLLPVPAGPIAVIGSIVVLASFDGMYRSTNLGRTWQNSGLMFAVSLLNKDGVLYAGTNSYGLYRSTDSGATWNAVDSSGVLKGRSILTLSDAGNDIFAGATYDEGFFRSTDNGATWDSSNTGMINTVDTGKDCTVLALYQDGNRLLASTSSGIFVSYDSSLNWSLLCTTSVDAIIRSGSYLLAGTPAELLFSNSDGASWFPLHSGINGSVEAMAAVGPYLFASANGLIYRSADSGTSWDEAVNGFPQPIYSSINLTTFGNILFANTVVYPSKVSYFTTDFGNDWMRVPDSAITPLAALGTSLVGVSGNELYLSTDTGITWTDRGSMGQVNKLTSLVTDGSDIYFSDYAGYVSRSTDSGSTWIGWEPNSGTCTALCSDGNFIFCGTGSDVFIGQQSGIYRGNINEDTGWEAINGGLALIDSTSGLPAVDPITTIVADSNNVFFGSANLGVFYSSNFGTFWDSINRGLPTRNIVQLLIDPPYIYAATAGQGIWRRALSDFGIVSPPPSAAVANIPLSEIDLTNYPNPFAQSTVISVSTVESGDAEIRVVNALGAEVARLYSGELVAGNHSYEWNASGLPAGLYECLVRMNGSAMQARMLLLPN